MPGQLRIFINYAREDEEAVRILDTWLQSKGCRTWLDKEQLLPGHDWPLEIRRAVEQSDIIFVCLSRRSVTKTGYVQKELRLILDAADLRPPGKIFIVPIRLDECVVPDGLERLQHVDLWASDAYDRLELTLNYEQGKANVEDQLKQVATARVSDQSDTVEEIDKFIRATDLDDVTRIFAITILAG